MSYSDMLLKRIRELNAELERFGDATSPEQAAQRDQILEALAWYVHKLQMRVLSSANTVSVSPAVPGMFPLGAAEMPKSGARVAAQ